MLELLPGGVVRYNNREVDILQSSVPGVFMYKRGTDVVFEGRDGKEEKMRIQQHLFGVAIGL